MTVRDCLADTSETFAFEREDDIIFVRIGGTGGEAVYNVHIENGKYVYMRGDTELDREDRDN